MADAVGTTRRGRGARKTIRQTRDVTMLPALKRRLPLTEPMDQDQIEKIDAASMSVLEDVGVVFRDPIAIADWRAAGADIRDGDVVMQVDGLSVQDLMSDPLKLMSYSSATSLPVTVMRNGRKETIYVNAASLSAKMLPTFGLKP